MSSSSEKRLNETEREMLKAARTRQPHKRDAVEAALGLSPGNKHSLGKFTPTAGVEDWKEYRIKYDLINWNDTPPEEETPDSSESGERAGGEAPT